MHAALVWRCVCDVEFLVMELQLILEVEKRPSLYDKDLNVYKKQNVRIDAWNEIAAALNSTEVECRKKWRSLRDQFIKYYRTHQNAGLQSRKRHWIYYNEMMFLIPHIGPKDAPGDRTQQPTDDDSKIFHSTFGQQSNDSLELQYGKRPRMCSDTDEDRNDADEQFLLSCAPVLKRFTPRQNAFAKMKIQQILYEIEFESDQLQEEDSYNVYVSSAPIDEPYNKVDAE